MNKVILGEIDTSRLSQGMKVKNYKALCEVLGEQVKTGKSKKLQMHDWERYFEFQKVQGSQQIVINEIYEQPKEKIDKRLDGIYVKSIEVILLYELARCKNYTAYFTRNQLWHRLGMVNENYKKISTDELKNIDCCLTDYEINHFYQRADARLTGILNTALDSLRKRWVIEYSEEYMIVDKQGRRRRAEDIDVKNIITLKNRVAKMLGCRNSKEVFFEKMKTAEYYKLLNYYYDYHFGWKYVYRRYKLIFNTNIVKEEIPVVEKELQRELLNANIIKALNTTAENNYKKSEDQENFNLPTMYLKAQNLLADTLIKLDTEHKTEQESESKLFLSEDEKSELDLELDTIFDI